MATASRRIQRRAGGARKGPGPRRWWLVPGILGALAAAALWWGRGPAEAPVAALPGNETREPVIPDAAEAYAGYAGSASCQECHEEAYELWERSHHGLAERVPDPERDRPAFDPPRAFRHGSQESAVRIEGTESIVTTLGLSGRPEDHAVVRVIGHDPLRQFLVSFPGGRLQTLEASYDPRTNEWFNVYGAEDRQPGEWGHWTGRGMNWNHMCAGCHNVRVRKNYDEATDTYRTTMVELGVGCEACHGPARAHVEWRRENRLTTLPDPTLPLLSTNQVRETCGTCHARRGDLTGDFVPGDSFYDHYSLTVVDHSDVYYPDGQVRDENYEYAAFLGSRMGQAGVRCLDCHHPHSARTILPGNWLCLRCHDGTYPGAVAIEPVSHSRHKVFGYATNGVLQDFDLTAYQPRTIVETGGECVNCHMPQTVYMQRHWRHDHGFTIPDPLLTRELGIPNACNRCHQDKSVDWALGYVEEWYGAKMERSSRERTRVVAAGRAGQAAARAPLVALLAGETNTYWRAVVAELLAAWVHEPEVSRALQRSLDDPHPLVREKAVRSLGAAGTAGSASPWSALVPRLEDPSRSVRVAAALALRDRVELGSRAGRELQHGLALNADQPTGQMQKGAFLLARGDLPGALAAYRKAVTWDGYSAPLRHELAVVLSLAGEGRAAVEELQAACRLEPREAEYQYKLGLAWNEVGNAAETLIALEQAVALDPRHARAWYNLGLARHAAGRSEEALEALVRAESAAPLDPRIPYARATILIPLGRLADARVAAARALEVDRDFAPARELLQRSR